MFYWWVAIELNLLAFIGWLLRLEERVDLKIKYFIIQRFGSAFFFVSLLLISWRDIFSSLVLTSLVWKLGLAPLHFWFIQIVQGMKKNSMLFLFTVQKFLPFLVLLSFLDGFFFWGVSGLRVLVSLVGATFQKNWKKILAYSSIFSGSWLLLTVGEYYIFFLFFFIYTLRLIVALIAITDVGVRVGGDTNLNINRRRRFLIILGLLRIGGVPPFLGFFGKILILIKSLFVISYYFLICIIISSVYIIYIYIRLFYISLGSHFLNRLLTFSQLNFIWVAAVLFCGRFLILFILRESINTLRFELRDNN